MTALPDDLAESLGLITIYATDDIIDGAIRSGPTVALVKLYTCARHVWPSVAEKYVADQFTRGRERQERELARYTA